MDIVLLVAGLIVLVAGGEALVRSAAGIALKAHIPPLVVGLTIVSIGTSAPELFASLSAALSDAPGLAIGNVVGSNIANIALVLGATALINPIPIFRNMLYFDLAAMSLVSLVMLLLAHDGELTRTDGILFLMLIIAYIISLLLRARSRRAGKPKEKNISRNIEDDVEELKGFSRRGYGFLVLMVVLGCVALYFGANWFVEGAKGFARRLNISDYVIGVTIVAFGTSIPELVASLIAALRQQTDISIGNLIGSNIFNIGLVLGTTTVIAPMKVDDHIISHDLWWMLGISLLLFPIVLSGYRVNRWEGAGLVSIYIAYIYMVIA